ncbi:hypothetical protein E8E15_005115 [Penicillium rubens]|jgi:hypothetical protein|uniref:Pc13g15230 protein n=2 Tax=Penicillium chrysogenum species complex TaxID=254878 RepID=B6H2S3_PENRW|nr:uncharacterized protein N7525_002520 [Penicillium rubens]KZN84320.1 hypothetical protein EN45_114420 [Penicillium chrysogenum]CAP92592.1 Pc13g15230 [Penicillium rubens Wisconsin 54-1255]KAF3013668.1 hypothetical protein E8E15_005115 [Penicillium rubens]KAJ5032115.1 hypothetical protein NUH16_011297 [Penicillium rubens]KAJ5837332.1 hypothetical protein N7525_002520 [Penicillium rubens]
MNPSQSLQDACSVPDSLLAHSDEDLIRLVYKQFPQEIDRLRRAYSIRDGPWTPPSTPSPSYILYNEEYDEVNRTLVGLLALRWIHTGQYETFVGLQPSASQLTRTSFDWIRGLYTQLIKDANALFTLITSIIINDIGKDPQLATDCHAKTGVDFSTLNHDAILLVACKAGLVPSLDQLPGQYRDDVLRAIELGATFNFGQLAQAENAPASLSGLHRMKGHDRSFRLRFMEQLLDIAGAAGHMDWTCAKKLTQPIFDSYRNVYDVCEGVIAGTLTVRSGYDLILIRRAKFLRDKDVRRFQVEENPGDRALMRLFCMGNVTTQEKALLYEDAWRALEDPVRETLANALNLDGRRSEPAVQPTYMPALLDRIQDVNALVCTLRYLAQVLSATDDADPSAVVIERSVYSALKQFVESDEFREDPTILERVEVPDGVVALTTASL